MDRKRFGAWAVLAAATACGGGGGHSAPEAVGVWELVTGPAFLTPQGEESFGLAPQFLVLESDGAATLISQEPTSLAVVCDHGIYTTTRDSLLVELSRRFDAPTFTFHRRHPDALTMELTEAGGSVSRFDRRASVPGELACTTFATRSLVTDLPAAPQFFGGLAWDGASFWFTAEDDLVYPFDAGTDTLGTPLPFGFSQFRLVHAVQGADFWVTCGCGHGQEAQRRTSAAVLVDSVDTLLDLGDELDIFAMAFDPAAGVLWLQGFDFQDTIGRFMKVDTDAEPDVLLSSADFDFRLRGLTWDGTHLWAVSLAQTIVEIDVATMKVVASFQSPSRDVEWSGIAFAPSVAHPGENALFVIGTFSSTGLGAFAELDL